MSEQYPNTVYRVAVKALISDANGKILLIKERSDKWDLPGGGLDHGELPEEGIRRELREELGIDGAIVGNPITVKSFWVAKKEYWLVWIVYRVELSNTRFSFGDGVTAIEYLDPAFLADSSDEREQFIPQIAH